MQNTLLTKVIFIQGAFDLVENFQGPCKTCRTAKTCIDEKNQTHNHLSQNNNPYLNKIG